MIAITDPQLDKLLTICVLIVQLATGVFAYLAKQKAADAERQSKENSKDLKQVKKQTNHITEQLVKETGEASQAKGNLAGRAELKEEQATEAKETPEASKAKLPLMLVVAFLLTGCAHTTIWEGGKKVFTTQADAENVDFSTSSTRFHADKLNHSTPTLAQGKAASDKFNAAGGVLTGLGAGALFR